MGRGGEGERNVKARRDRHKEERKRQREVKSRRMR
jgi:hypothetical protein